MSKGKLNPNTNHLDPALVAKITREVLSRLNATSIDETEPANPTFVPDQVISAKTIVQLAGMPAEIQVAPRAVITPAAEDEAKQRGIKILRATAELIRGTGSRPNANGTASSSSTPNTTSHRQSSASPTSPSPLPITDTQQPERAAAIVAQLAHRGIHRLPARVLLSETPAADVHRLCTSGGQRAAMVNSLADVHRFAAELQPTCWVLDMLRLNFVTAVNIVAQIAKRGS